MLVIGKNAKFTGQSQQLYTCGDCNQKAVSHSFLVKYVHLFWIPLFPYKRDVISVCGHCKAVRDLADSGEANRIDMLSDKKKYAKTPLWTFIGLFIIVGLMLYGEFRRTEMKKTVEAFVKQPTAESVMIVKTNSESYPYALLRVSKDDQGNLVMRQSKYGYSFRSAQKAFDNKDYLSGDYFYDDSISIKLLPQFEIIRVEAI